MGDQAAPVGPAAGGEPAKPTLVPVENPPSPLALANDRKAARDAKIAASRAAREAGATFAPSSPEVQTTETETKIALTPKPEEKPAAKVEPKGDDTPSDPQTAKALEAIQKRDARAREQLDADRRAARAEIDKERAELARMKAELTGKSTPLDELKKLPANRRAIEALKLAGIDPDDEEAMEVIARDAYARSKSGKADPKNRAYANEVAEKHGVHAEIAELRAQLEETRESLKQQNQRAQAEQFQKQYLDEAVKAVPKDPTFIGRALGANATKARNELLAIGMHLEKQNGETPTHSEVIAEYEKLARQDFTDRGFTAEMIDALLKPAAAKPTVSAAAIKTLDPGVGPKTPPSPNGLTRDEKIAKARAERLRANVTT